MSAEVLHYLETAYGVMPDSPEDKESLAGQNSDLDIGGDPAQASDPSDPPRPPSRGSSEAPRPPSRCCVNPLLDSQVPAGSIMLTILMSMTTAVQSVSCICCFYTKCGSFCCMDCKVEGADSDTDCSSIKVVQTDYRSVQQHHHHQQSACT